MDLYFNPAAANGPGKLGVAPIRRSMASKWCGIVLNPNKAGSGLSNVKIIITLVAERDGVREEDLGIFPSG
jgi:hypothetical protein